MSGVKTMDALLFDTAQDARPLIGHLGLTGCVGVGRYLFAGATDAQGNVPQPVATPLTPDEAQAILAGGLAILPIDNGIGWGDTTGPNAYANGQRKAQQAVARAQAMSVPAGTYIAFDLEDWAVDPDFFRGYCQVMRQSPYAGSGIVYGSLGGAWRQSFQQASQQDADVARCLIWTGRWIGSWTGTPPAWDPQDPDPRCVLWQFTDQGPQGVDLSLVRLPLASIGPVPEGLWLPGGKAGSPMPPAPAQPPQASPPPAQQPQTSPSGFVQVPFTIQGGEVTIQATFASGGRSLTPDCIVDTGDAVGPMVGPDVAQQLGLPNFGPVQVSGVGGQVASYWTQVDITVGGVPFPGVRAVVDPAWQGPPLLGLPFWRQAGNELVFDFAASVLGFGIPDASDWKARALRDEARIAAALKALAGESA